MHYFSSRSLVQCEYVKIVGGAGGREMVAKVKVRGRRELEE